MIVSFKELKESIKNALLRHGVSEDKAEIMAKVHSESTLKGINSHGINRIPRLIDFIEKELIDINADLELINKIGVIENYDGNLGFGVINAVKLSNRCSELARENGIAMVTIKNTTHWMRGGTYAEIMADNGMIGMCWTNTESLMPAWGSDEISVGNNPIAISIPSKNGNISLDMAMSLYSYGKLETTKLKNQKLPYPGGFDIAGNLTDDPKLIEESKRLLPTGYWKGSGLAICLDTMAAMLSNGKSTYDLDREKVFNCTGCSQIFIAMNPIALSTEEENEKTIELMRDTFKNLHSIDEDKVVRYPGLGSQLRMEKALKEGIYVDDEIYKKVCEI